MAISPTVRSRVLARRLFDLRKAAGYTQADVAKGLDWRQSKVSRIEAREQSVSVTDAAALGSFYGASAEERALLTALARDAKETGWWQSYDLIPAWFSTYVGMEAEAESVSTYESEFIPGLLQTEDYARAATRATWLGASHEEVETVVEVRLRRQQRLLGQDSLRLWAMMSEAALLRSVGGDEVLRDQLAHLVEMASRPNVTMQVMPFSAGANPSVGPFVFLTYPQEWHPDLVYVENRAGAQWLDDRTGVGTFRAVLEQLRTLVLTPDDSITAVRDVMGDLGGGVHELAHAERERGPGQLRRSRVR